MKNLNWALLRSFLAVAETGSLSAAAAQIGTTQPTLSRHMRELELLLGMPLFHRSVQGLEPTEAALGLIDDARAMGEAAQALARKAQGRSQRLTGTVRISASVVVANLILPPILRALREAEPNIQLELVASDMAQNLLRRDADIAVRMFDPTQKALIARRLGDTPLGFFATRSFLDRHGPIESTQALIQRGILGFDRSDAIVKAFAAQGHPVTREDFPIRCDDQMVYWNLLMAGAGIGIAQILLARRHPHLVQIETDLQMPVLPVWLVMHEEVRNSARIRRVADFLADALRNWLETMPAQPYENA
ncbi:LysR family transcriptional regulator [Sphingomonas sp.]|uniref:LysR family transcriptional regulator n=1 Tax=Sphingomonas sp. TaxID=28214 RepID=UPI003B3A643E